MKFEDWINKFGRREGIMIKGGTIFPYHFLSL